MNNSITNFARRKPQEKTRLLNEMYNDLDDSQKFQYEIWMNQRREVSTYISPEAHHIAMVQSFEGNLLVEVTNA